jgi:hypothetical protein
MPVHLSALLFLFLVLILLAGCAGGQYYENMPPELVPLAKYDEALTTLVGTKESFNTAVNAETDPAVRKKLLDIGYPLFKRADSALAVWETAVDSGQDELAKMRAYQLAWYELINALLQLGIVEVK